MGNASFFEARQTFGVVDKRSARESAAERLGRRPAAGCPMRAAAYAQPAAVQALATQRNDLFETAVDSCLHPCQIE